MNIKRTPIIMAIIALMSLASVTAFSQSNSYVPPPGYALVPIAGGLSTNAPGLLAAPAGSAVATGNATNATSFLGATTGAGPILQQFESYIVDNDQTCTAWVSNRFTLAETAVFASVKGQAGESSVGNDLIAELSLYKNTIGVDSATRFEQLFGDIADQEFGVDWYFYTSGQIRLTGGVDGRWIFQTHRLQAVPNLRFEKASMALHGLGTFIQYGLPITSNPGWGELKVGAMVPF